MKVMAAMWRLNAGDEAHKRRRRRAAVATALSITVTSWRVIISSSSLLSRPQNHRWAKLKARAHVRYRDGNVTSSALLEPYSTSL